MQDSAARTARVPSPKGLALPVPGAPGPEKPHLASGFCETLGPGEEFPGPLWADPLPGRSPSKQRGWPQPPCSPTGLWPAWDGGGGAARPASPGDPRRPLQPEQPGPGPAAPGAMGRAPQGPSVRAQRPAGPSCVLPRLHPPRPRTQTRHTSSSSQHFINKVLQKGLSSGRGPSLAGPSRLGLWGQGGQGPPQPERVGYGSCVKIKSGGPAGAQSEGAAVICRHVRESGNLQRAGRAGGGGPPNRPCSAAPGCRCWEGRSGPGQRRLAESRLEPQERGFGVSWGWPRGLGAGALGKLWQGRRLHSAQSCWARARRGPGCRTSTPATEVLTAGGRWGGRSGGPWPSGWASSAPALPAPPLSLQHPSRASGLSSWAGSWWEESEVGSAGHSSGLWESLRT